MALTSCQRAYSVLFWILLFTICSYVMYAGSIVPMLAKLPNKLRYNQLNELEVYAMPYWQWFNFSIADKGIAILTFTQQIPYNYTYLLAVTASDDAIQSLLSSDSGNNSISNHHENNTSLIDVGWNEFALFMEMDAVDHEYIYIVQYSNTFCDSDFVDCFYNSQTPNQVGLLDDECVIYTRVNHAIPMKFNSELFSTFLDDPRDGFGIVIGIALVMILWCIFILLQSKELTKTAFGALLSVCSVYGSYLLWLFALNVIPVFFSLPLDLVLSGDANYFNSVSHSLVYGIGYEAKYLVLFCGLSIIHGIWSWTLVMFFPCIAVLYGFVLCASCCKERTADKISLYIILPFALLVIVALFLMSLCYVLMFLVTIMDWNELISAHYLQTDIYIIQIGIGVLCIWIVVPICACIVTCMTDCTDHAYVHRMTQKVYNLPVIRACSKRAKSPRYQQRQYKQYDGLNQDHYENETAGMNAFGYELTKKTSNLDQNDDEDDDEHYMGADDSSSSDNNTEMN